MSYRVGVDIGGTFADFCFFDDTSNKLFTRKVLTTPSNPGVEVMEGLEIMSEVYGIDPSDVVYFTHGQTIGVNSVIQRTGARLCLFTTENFSDVLELQRLRMADAYNLLDVRPAPLIPKDCVIQVRERLSADGSVRIPLDVETVRSGVRKAKSLGAEGIVISFLHSYKNPQHELEAQAIVREECPDLFVFCSSEVSPVIREYERTVTVVINGYVHPKVRGYLSSLQQALKDRGIKASPMITKSNGGVMSAERGKTACVHTLLSGPASGVIGAAYLGRLAGEKNIITMDMGGTSLDVSLVVDGRPQLSEGEHVGDFPIYIPAISVSSIGAGGGSIAWVDSFGVLKVGPGSAGSDPGPACYGKGGAEPALTDAFAACGYLNEANFAYGSVKLSSDLAKKAVGKLARRLQLGELETAEAIIRVSLSGMFLEMSKLIARWGIDPRQFALLPFGGAGPMMACFLAREVGIRRVVVPKTPGVLCAFGGLAADIKNDFVKTLFIDLNEAAVPAIRTSFKELSDAALEWLAHEQQYTGEPRLFFSADMRYRGQSFEIEVPLEEPWIANGDIDSLAGAFNDHHEGTYGYCDRSAPTQVVAVRAVIVAETQKPEYEIIPQATSELEAIAHHDIYSEGKIRSFAFYRRDMLKAGHSFSGPAIVAQDDTTTCVLDGFQVRVDRYGNLIVES